MKHIYSFKDETCDEITSNGKRCKNSFLYKYTTKAGEKIIKDCGKYCSKHCELWILKLIKSLVKGSAIINGNVKNKVSVNIVEINRGEDYLEERELSVSYNTSNGKEGAISSMVFTITENDGIEQSRDYIMYNSKEYKSVDDYLSKISEYLCNDSAEYRVAIKIPTGSDKIVDVEFGGIRGWRVTPSYVYTLLTKTYQAKVEEEGI